VIDLRDQAGNPFGEEHAWWAERPVVRGVPADPVARRRREQAEREAAEREAAERTRRYWSGERLIAAGRAGAHWWAAPDADPYAVLGVLPGATLADISAARRRLAKAHHPDLVELSGAAACEAAERMAAVNRAYQELRRMLGPQPV
jgi:DnaJ-domain-containing protein 1